MARIGRSATAPGRRPPRSPFRIGLVALVLVAIGVYFGFTKHVPFTHGYRVHAVFQSANNIKPGSPVRIAGVNVGKVTKVSRYKDTNDSDVTMEIQKKGLPIHSDATLKIRPRIFLEGNFFVDVRPGSPSSPAVPDGGTIAVAQTSTPVQLDQVLTSLQSDSRQQLQVVLQQYGKSLTEKPTPAQDATLPPETRGLTAAQALNQSYDTAPEALRGSALVNSALLGTQPHDLSNLIGGVAKLSKGLASDETSLQNLLVDFNTTAGATASVSSQLAASIRLLGPTLTTARDAFVSLDAAFPPVRAFAREILPGVKETPATIAAAFPFIKATRALLAPDELGGLLDQLTPATSDLGQLTRQTIELMPQINDLNQCFANEILPTINVPIRDGALSTRRPDGSIVPNYEEFWSSLVGMAGEGQSFDGNGSYIRGAVPGGTTLVNFGREDVADPLTNKNKQVDVEGLAPEKPLGTRPLLPQKSIGYTDTKLCASNPLPNLNGSQSGPGRAPHSMVVPQLAPGTGAPDRPNPFPNPPAEVTGSGG